MTAQGTQEPQDSTGREHHALYLVVHTGDGIEERYHKGRPRDLPRSSVRVPAYKIPFMLKILTVYHVYDLSKPISDPFLQWLPDCSMS